MSIDLLNQAAHNGDLEQVIKYVESGININEPDDYGMTPLMWATMGGRESVVKYIISKNVRLAITRWKLNAQKGVDSKEDQDTDEDTDYDSLSVEGKLKVKEEENTRLKRRIADLETQLMELKRDAMNSLY
ncbi:acyl-CoA-binding domain-containing protein [Acrasis kona]|uniref:Acyl-CoA-binding domain-containing protein n=1 Tax=Acrasis kona TaxID=1008807 RepID=A0AAW2YTE0_9EUKA